LEKAFMEGKYKVWFFSGAETRDDRFNVFTGSFIRMMRKILGEDFDFIKGVYFKSTARNVFWALNNAQRPSANTNNKKIFFTALKQITDKGYLPETQLILISSSSGSVVAAQTACFLAGENIIKKPFHLVLGASMISPESELYRKLLHFQSEGLIGTILHEEMHDEGDNSAGVGGTSRLEAFRNAFGIMFPAVSFRYSSPSFLNAHPETGHIHRKRSKTVQKAIDYINIILVRHKLAGDHFKQRALEELNRINDPD
jgi:hypothetical protein